MLHVCVSHVLFAKIVLPAAETGATLPQSRHYVTMLPLLVFGISVFVCMAAVLLFVHNRQAKKYTAEK